MKIVVIDAQHLTGEVEFPPLQAHKYGWEQYPSLDQQDIIERCWRANILISLQTPLAPAVLEKLTRVVMLITPGGTSAAVDAEYLRSRNIVWHTVGDAFPATVDAAQQFCLQACETIDALIAQNNG